MTDKKQHVVSVRPTQACAAIVQGWLKRSGNSSQAVSAPALDDVFEPRAERLGAGGRGGARHAGPLLWFVCGARFLFIARGAARAN